MLFVEFKVHFASFGKLVHGYLIVLKCFIMMIEQTIVTLK